MTEHEDIAAEIKAAGRAAMNAQDPALVRRLRGEAGMLARREAEPFDEPEPRSLPTFEVQSVVDLLKRPAPSWLVRDVLPDSGLAVIYGASGAGKTFAALDLTLAIVRGVAWFGRRVRRGRVVYVASEGSLALRLRAYMDHHEVTAGELTGLGVVEQSINLLDGDHATALLLAIGECARERRWDSVDLIVIDTLNRAMPGGDENGSQDMGRMVSAAKDLQADFHCTVAYVHHAGKDASKGSRGHSSLKAATDCEILVNGDTPRVLRAEKVRDGESGVDLGGFNLEWVDLGPTSAHDPEAGADERDGSCVVEPCEVPSRRGQERLPPQSALALSYLHQTLSSHATLPPSEVIRGTGKDGPESGKTGCPLGAWRAYCRDVGGLTEGDDEGTQKKAFHRARQTLEKRGIIGVFKAWVWLRGQGDIKGTSG